MKTDPRVQKFYDEALAAKKELKRLASDIASHRIELADLPVFPTGKVSINSTIIPDVAWALENGRTDLAARMIELADQYNNSMGTAAMMQIRVNAELHQKAVQAMANGDLPPYLDADDGEVSVIRMAPGEGGELTPVDDDS